MDSGQGRIQPVSVSDGENADFCVSLQRDFAAVGKRIPCQAVPDIR